ncbi:MAG: extracellular solute-binding protein, partial [Pseudomonadota bacterium]|nr:extracellular solute-binding protein [Pseudomonadota bacterium]
MKRKVFLITAAAAALALAIGLQPAPAEAAGTLNVYKWGEYISPEILDQFGKEFDVKVNLDTYSSNEEMLAKIQAGATGYDLVFPSVHMNDIMIQLDLLEKANVNQMPGFENIDKSFLRAKNDPNGEYCLPYAWGNVGIYYNKERVPDGLKSWADFFAYAEKNPGSVTLLDDMRE